MPWGGRIESGYAGRVTHASNDHARTSNVLGEPAPVSSPGVSTRTVIIVGTALWAVALVVTLVVPSLHTGERSWWPWTCVTGIGLGLFAGWYVRRGWGSAAGA
jgi:hypothetical protein